MGKEINKHTAKATTIKNFIIATDTDERGDLLLLVSKMLKRESQFHTALAIKYAAHQYGVKYE